MSEMNTIPADAWPEGAVAYYASGDTRLACVWAIFKTGEIGLYQFNEIAPDFELPRGVTIRPSAAESELRAEVERLTRLLESKVASEAILTDIGINGNAMFAQIEGGACAILANAFSEQFIEHGAENYLEMSFSSPRLGEGESMVVTLQRAKGKTPHALRAEAEDQLRRITANWCIESDWIEDDESDKRLPIERRIDTMVAQLKAQSVREAELRADVDYVCVDNNKLREELEIERMRLVACGVVAMCDTESSAKEARDMHPDYRSASCDDVARRVDECIALRADVARLQGQSEGERKITDMLLFHIGLDASAAFTESGVPNPGRLAAILKDMK